MPEPEGAALPPIPAATPAPALPPRSEALQAELGALEAMLPPEPARPPAAQPAPAPGRGAPGEP